MCPLQGLKMFPSPACRLIYRSPLSAVSSTCKEITRDKCYGSVRLALFTASLTKKCVVWNWALSKWQCLHNGTSVTRSILNWSKSNSYFWSLVGQAPEGTPSMHSSWWEHRGACAGCRSVESHLFMEGGLVCEWLVSWLQWRLTKCQTC